MGDHGVQVTLVLSGGGSPSGNNYSQYLQALRLAEFYQSKSGVTSEVLFGSGLNAESSADATPDVHRKPIHNGQSTFVRGVIPHNKAATHDNIRQYFQRLALRNWQQNDDVLLIVADHGMPNYWDPRAVDSTKYENNCIDLWQPEITIHPEERCLSVDGFRNLIKESIPSDVQTRFVMTQCYSGGFHTMGYNIGNDGIPRKEGEICGFTAITEDTTAAGCTPFVSEQTYDGYERRMAEAITGRSVMSGEQFAEPIASLLEAHQSTLLTDNTKDVPLRTSEFFLLDFAKAVAKKSAPNEKEGAGEEKKAGYNAYHEWDALKSDDGVAVSRLSEAVRTDFKSRLAMVEKLLAQFESWNRFYIGELKGASLSSVAMRRTSMRNILDVLRSKESEIESQYHKLMNPLRVAYRQSLTDAESLEFELMRTQNSQLAYTRFFREDSSLQKYERFYNYVNQRDKAVLEWAKKSGKIDSTKYDKIAQVKQSLDAIATELTRGEVIEGQLRRIEYQMRVAAVTAYLAKTPHDSVHRGILRDLESFINCEREI